MGQFGGVNLDTVGVQLLECLGYLCMKPNPAAGRQLLSQGLLNQGVGEPVAFPGAWYFLDQIGSYSLLHRRQQITLIRAMVQRLE